MVKKHQATDRKSRERSPKFVLFMCLGYNIGETPTTEVASRKLITNDHIGNSWTTDGSTFRLEHRLLWTRAAACLSNHGIYTAFILFCFVLFRLKAGSLGCSRTQG